MAGRAAAAPWSVPSRADLPPGEVHVWRAALDLESPPVSPPLLSAAERSRAEAYRFEPDRRRFLAARTLLRLLLSAYAGAPPAELEFDTTCRFCGKPHGKPRLLGADPGLDFSLSYAGDAFLLAISAAGPVGADVEAVPGLEAVDDLLGAAATAAEARAMGEGDGRRALARLWTLKEAVLKATGHGLAVDPRALELAGLDSEAPQLVAAPEELGPPSRWHLRSLDQGGPYAAAVALPLAPDAIETRRIEMAEKEQESPSS